MSSRFDAVVARRRVAVLGGFLLLLVGCGGNTGADSSGGLRLERFDAGFFAIDKPVGWEVLTAGSCSTFAFVMRDERNPLWQIFYFGTVGPVYLSQEQKDLDAWYVEQGGFPHTWLDAPVIDPLTPANYLAHWPEIADMDAASDFMSGFPQLDDLGLVATATQAPMVSDGATGNARGLFGLDGAVGEGMFLGTVKVFLPDRGVPGGGIGYGYFNCGVTAPEGEFADAVERMIASLESFTVTQAYVNDCLEQQQQIWGAIAAAGQTLSEASDIMWEGWEARTQTEDISAEQWTDAYRDVERVYDPANNEVYEVPAGWYEDYDLHRNEYDLSGLQPLPADDWELWMRTVLDGEAEIH